MPSAIATGEARARIVDFNYKKRKGRDILYLLHSNKSIVKVFDNHSAGYLNMKMDQKNMIRWVGIALAVLVIGFGLWWLMGERSSVTVPSTTATSTELSGAGQVQVETSSKSVSAIVSEVANGTRFAQLLASTGVGATLTGKGPYTVFVATDGAFSRLSPGTINNMSAAQLKRTIQYHIVAKRLDVDAVNSGQVQALSRDTLNFNVDTTKGAVYVNSGYVLKAYKATNGIVYVINSVLLPPTAQN
jgi:uncharacterized surface protein with fasciclin (FAS1) repeats